VKIAFVCAEVYPFIKTGGLADVAYALPKALVKLGHEVVVMLPSYKQIPRGMLNDAYWVSLVEVYERTFNLYCVELERVKYYLINEPLFSDRESIYDNVDSDYQFAMFCEVTLQLLKSINFQPRIIHANDWHTGLIPFFMNQHYYRDPFYYDTKTIYTIHNLKFQGQFSSRAVRELGYSFEADRINYMQLGIEYAHKVTTVSETYAREILTDYYGENLNHILQKRSHDLYGIINGIDLDLFNPSTDQSLIQCYDINSIELKGENKLALQRRFRMEEKVNIPLIGMVTRLDSQKGLDLLMCVLEDILYHNVVQFFLLGSGEAKYETFFQSLRDRYPHKFGIYLGYDAKLANLIYGASDLFLMPSLYEPCGLSQLIALHYGAIPIVRETGGLNDTVQSYNETTKEGNGFSFTHYNAHDMMYTIGRALDYYHNRKNDWKIIIENGMSGDNSWEKSAKSYADLYDSV